MPLTICYTPNYFSLEDLTVTQERLPCKLECDVLRLGFLNVGSDKEYLEQSSTMELPYWLAESLTLKKIVSVDIPRAYKERTRDVFEADAKVVDLYRVNSHFYEFGHYLVSMNHRESELIRTVLVQAFKERFRIIMDWADNIMTEPKKIQQLDYSERCLLKIGHKARKKLDNWLTNGIGQMKASNMVINLRKRKHFLVENS